ncbi:MAG: TetR/AcrR family transcriptional regulator [Myxococcota bacterium]|nr:TetR/AcrR family transcriptional regulator [Myxococcota bacterium]
MAEVDDRTRQRLARKARRQERKRLLILAAARSVLIAEGLDGMTTAAVAAAADTSTSTLYYYYSSRQALIDAIAISQLSEDVTRMEAAVAAETDPVDALIAMVQAHVRHYAARPEHYFLYEGLSRAGLSPEALVSGVYPLSTRLNDMLEERLIAGQQRGLVHPEVYPRQLANAAWCMAQGILVTTLSFARSGGSMLFSVEALLSESCTTLARGARAQDPAGGSDSLDRRDNVRGNPSSASSDTPQPDEER